MKYLVIPKAKINVMRTLISNARSGFGKNSDLNPIELANGDFILPKSVMTDNSLGQFTTLVNSQNPSLFQLREVSQNEFKIYTE